MCLYSRMRAAKRVSSRSLLPTRLEIFHLTHGVGDDKSLDPTVGAGTVVGAIRERGDERDQYKREPDRKHGKRLDPEHGSRENAEHAHRGELFPPRAQRAYQPGIGIRDSGALDFGKERVEARLDVKGHDGEQGDHNEQQDEFETEHAIRPQRVQSETHRQDEPDAADERGELKDVAGDGAALDDVFQIDIGAVAERRTEAGALVDRDERVGGPRHHDRGEDVNYSKNADEFHIAPPMWLFAVIPPP